MLHKSVLIMAGGTGGHVYPALAVADYLRQHDVTVTWLGTANGIESRLVPDHGYRLIVIGVSGLRGKGIWKLVTAPVMIMAALIRTLLVIMRIKPDAVLGMGGFVSGPGGIAAWLCGVPLYIHEQNSIAGLTNRLLAPFAKIVMEGFPHTFKPGVKVHSTGNPVRADLIRLTDPEHRLQDRGSSCLRLLVIGGSQGARVFNEILPATLKQLDGKIDIDVWHQTGERNYSAAVNNYSSIEGLYQIRIEPYINNMAEAYTWADIVLCRAGALTLAEICAVGIASILVPYPHAVDDHQTANARFLSEHDCAVLLPEAELDEEKLSEILSEFTGARKKLVQMARSARQLARAEATREVGDICMGVAYA